MHRRARAKMSAPRPVAGTGASVACGALAVRSIAARTMLLALASAMSLAVAGLSQPLTKYADTWLEEFNKYAAEREPKSKALPPASDEAVRAVKNAAREAVARGDPDAVVYWLHQRKAAGDLVVGCQQEGIKESTRRCSRRWSMLANTSALAVTNEWIGVPAGCLGIMPPPLDDVDLRGSPALARPGGKPLSVPAVFIGVVRHPLERWQSELSYSYAPVFDIDPLASLFLPRSALELLNTTIPLNHDGTTNWKNKASRSVRAPASNLATVVALTDAPASHPPPAPVSFCPSIPAHEFVGAFPHRRGSIRWAFWKMGIEGNVSPRADATDAEIAAGVDALRVYMRGAWQRRFADKCMLHNTPQARRIVDGHWNNQRPTPLQLGRVTATTCYFDNLMVRLLASNACKCRMYDAAAHAKAVAPDMRILFNSGLQLGPRIYPSADVSEKASQPDGERELLPEGLGPTRVGHRTGCEVDYGQGQPPRADAIGSGIVPVTEKDYERAKEVVRRFHALLPMEKVHREPTSFASILRALGGLNVSHDWSMGGNMHATGTTLRVLEVPGVREILEEDNRWDMKLYRYLHDELWEDYKWQASASAAPGRERPSAQARCAPVWPRSS